MRNRLLGKTLHHGPTGIQGKVIERIEDQETGTAQLRVEYTDRAGARAEQVLLEHEFTHEVKPL